MRLEKEGENRKKLQGKREEPEVRKKRKNVRKS